MLHVFCGCDCAGLHTYIYVACALWEWLSRMHAFVYSFICKTMCVFMFLCVMFYDGQSVCMCACVCIYMYICTYIWVRMLQLLLSCTCVWYMYDSYALKCACLSIHTYVCEYVWGSFCVSVHVYDVYAWECACLFIHTCMYVIMYVSMYVEGFVYLQMCMIFMRENVHVYPYIHVCM